MVAPAILARNMRKLYEQTPVDVRGPVSPQKRAELSDMSRRAIVANKLAMKEYGFVPLEYEREGLIADRIWPGNNGLINGYTDGREQGINLYTVHGTPEYTQLMSHLKTKGMRGRLASYILNKIGNQADAMESNMYTSVHENSHNLTQIRGMQDANGNITEPIVNITYRQLTGAFKRNLPRGKRWLASLYAMMTLKPFIEGMNELHTESVRYGKDARQVRDERGMGATSYDFFAATTADTAVRAGLDPGSEAMDLYSQSTKNHSYMGSFLEQHPMFQMVLNQVKNPGHYRN